jgi:hypothetical protein
MASLLNPERALIWRILHRSNLPWVLSNGLHCGTSAVRSTQWVSIGNAELINKRAAHPVPVEPGGVLNDYVPFYFTPHSIMLQNIRTGWNGITKVANEDIVFMVSSLHRVAEFGLRFLFTDSHAYSELARYFADIADLAQIDWDLLQRRDFKNDPEDPGKLGRYQAEALVHRSMPLAALLGIVCFTDAIKADIESKILALGLGLPVHTRPRYYFS